MSFQRGRAHIVDVDVDGLIGFGTIVYYQRIVDGVGLDAGHDGIIHARNAATPRLIAWVTGRDFHFINFHYATNTINAPAYIFALFAYHLGQVAVLDGDIAHLAIFASANAGTGFALDNEFGVFHGDIAGPFAFVGAANTSSLVIFNMDFGVGHIDIPTSAIFIAITNDGVIILTKSGYGGIFDGNISTVAGGVATGATANGNIMTAVINKSSPFNSDVTNAGIAAGTNKSTSPDLSYIAGIGTAIDCNGGGYIIPASCYVTSV